MWIRFVWWLPLPVFLAFFLWGMEARFPWIGHDFGPFFRQLIEGHWHFAHEGLAPMRYAVHLCGGMPMYGSPNELFYSLPQFLSFGMDLWRAMELSALFFLAAGYVGWWLLGRDVLRLGAWWSHVLALIVTSSGFTFLHVMVGHLNFFTMPLLGWLSWLLLSPRPRSMALLTRALLFGLLSGMILHAAGHQVLIFFGMLMALAMPLLLLYRDAVDLPRWDELLFRAELCLLAAVAIGASKLVAVTSLMHAFPRTTGGFSMFPTDASPTAYILRAFWMVPQDAWIFSGLPWGVHEYSMFLSPVVLLGAAVGLFLLLRENGPGPARRVLLLTYAVILFSLCVGIITGRGISSGALHALPLFSSLRVATRFLYVFSLLLAAGSVYALRCAARRYLPRHDAALATASLLLTLTLFPLAHRTVLRQLNLSVNYAEIRTKIDRLEAADFTAMPVVRVVAGDTDFLGTTGKICPQDALFTWAKQPQKQELVAGPVRTVRDGRFNMMHPACYAYPYENDCAPGDRIPASDRENLENFLSGGPLTWKLSPLQRLADGISAISLLFAVGWILWIAVRRVRMSL